jgi:hypothetical protein
LISPISVFKPKYKKTGQQKNYRHIFFYFFDKYHSEFRNIRHIEPIIKAPKGHEYQLLCSIKKESEEGRK